MRKVLFLIVFVLGANICLANEPCDFGDSTAWNGPDTLSICGDEFDGGATGPLSFPCKDCCYEIVYYDRWTSYGGGDNYEVFMSEVIYDDYENCAACIETNMLSFFRQIMRQYNTWDQTFYNRFTADDDYTMYFYTPGRCVDVNEEDCDDTERCCRKKMYVYFDENPLSYYPDYCKNGSSWVNFDPIQPNCLHPVLLNAISLCICHCRKSPILTVIYRAMLRHTRKNMNMEFLSMVVKDVQLI